MPCAHLALTPQGHLLLAPVPEESADAPPTEVSARLATAFARGAGHGLLQLGAGEVGTVLPATFSFWRDFGAKYVTAVCTLPAGAGAAPGVSDVSTAPAPDWEAAAAAAPPMVGAEYLSATVLAALWKELGAAFAAELAESARPLQEFLKARNPAWNLVGRVHFNLAENRGDEEAPFAFIATYTPRLSAQAKAQHLPLAQALREYSGTKHKAQLLSLLLPVQRAAERCAWVRELVESGELYHPLRWTVAEALQFLTDSAQLEAAGIVIRSPGSWAGGRPSRPRVTVRVGGNVPSLLGREALLDFDLGLTLDGDKLSAAEAKRLLHSTDGLQWLRGRWVEVDRDRLGRMLDHFRKLEAAAAAGMPFAEAVRLMAGATELGEQSGDTVDKEWAQVTAGPWLAETLRELRSPQSVAPLAGSEVRATLRPYQQAGVRWLHFLHRLRLGACLADDMGLGKTLQVLALLSTLKAEDGRTTSHRRTSLLVAPASLLANWAAEIARFVPHLQAFVAHASMRPALELQGLEVDAFNDVDLVITSYGSLGRWPWLKAMHWRIVVLDEAQAIKNAGAKQTRAAKELDAITRIALTGTPVENRLSDLWSIFDFTHPGLLGSAQAFSAFARRLAQSGQFAPLRELVRPYILRRLKTDKTVIADLPDKTELKAFCQLSAKQAALYLRAVTELQEALEDSRGGIQRKGMVLKYLMRFKQLCNHPSQWLGDGAWAEADSGKFSRLREITETIAAKQEKLLVFTQFRETTEPLAAFLGSIFGREGMILHGGTPVAKRRALVQRFQEDELVPFFVLSLKAGGAGLNLTAASHVVHFDRWWNPAVENQATDRAFRIGQHRNVLVHKFVCRGTVEDRIDRLIESKQQLVQDVLEGNAEVNLTEMSDKELLDLVALDINAAQRDA